MILSVEQSVITNGIQQFGNNRIGNMTVRYYRGSVIKLFSNMTFRYDGDLVIVDSVCLQFGM